MKVFKVLFNVLQIICIIIFSYFTFILATFNIEPVWLILILEFIIGATSFVGVFINNKITIQITSLTNIIIYSLFCFIKEFKLNVLFMIIIIALIIGNIINIMDYMERKEN